MSVDACGVRELRQYAMVERRMLGWDGVDQSELSLSRIGVEIRMLTKMVDGVGGGGEGGVN